MNTTTSERKLIELHIWRDFKDSDQRILFPLWQKQQTLIEANRRYRQTLEELQDVATTDRLERHGPSRHGRDIERLGDRLASTGHEIKQIEDQLADALDIIEIARPELFARITTTD